MPFCLAQVPKCNDPSKFSDRQVYANSVDPHQTPVPSGFTMFAILPASFWLIMSKNDLDQEWWLQLFLYSNLGKIRGDRREKGAFCICENKDAVTAKLISAFVSATRLE